MTKPTTKFPKSSQNGLSQTSAAENEHKISNINEKRYWKLKWKCLQRFTIKTVHTSHTSHMKGKETKQCEYFRTYVSSLNGKLGSIVPKLWHDRAKFMSKRTKKKRVDKFIDKRQIPLNTHNSTQKKSSYFCNNLFPFSRFWQLQFFMQYIVGKKKHTHTAYQLRRTNLFVVQYVRHAKTSMFGFYSLHP